MASDQNSPRVFISYSHDSPEHKKWVADLAGRLMSNGIDVILDQWDLGFGDDVPKFMERSVREADRVLMICTDKYVHKANEGQGGVGYEAMIVTAELVRDLGSSKFVPVIRQDTDTPELPVSVSTRKFINQSDGRANDEEFEQLIRDLHGAPSVPKPRLGRNPFLRVPRETEPRPTIEKGSPPSETPKELQSEESIEIVYENAVRVAVARDLYEWRRLVNRARTRVSRDLQAWRDEHEQALPNTWKDVLPLAVSGVATHAPLVAIALAGIQSTDSKFNNQRALLDDILYPRNWNRSGRTLIVDFPLTLAYVYQGVHGAACLATQQVDQAIKLAISRTQFPGDQHVMPFWKHPGAIGWPAAFEGNCATAWATLNGLYEQWPWLAVMFADSAEYKASLSAYYMALNVLEYVETLVANTNAIPAPTALRLEIPLCFETEDEDIKRRAIRLLSNEREQVVRLWRDRGIDDSLVRRTWPAWIAASQTWLKSAYRWWFRDLTTLPRLLDELLT
ncbi:MAG TPA: toll/interleukin-1 receptor domain-containing protein [Terriglobales bacterium]|nr:toll/interleukin-1 receptor domain-containing protein [Terriglobales bacterium]